MSVSTRNRETIHLVIESLRERLDTIPPDVSELSAKGLRRLVTELKNAIAESIIALQRGIG
jgi:hypothetical protein